MGGKLCQTNTCEAQIRTGDRGKSPVYGAETEPRVPIYTWGYIWVHDLAVGNRKTKMDSCSLVISVVIYCYNSKLGDSENGKAQNICFLFNDTETKC